jgi:hypothetical protein
MSDSEANCIFAFGILVGLLFGFFIGGCTEEVMWKGKIRAGKGPAMIEAVQLEDKARELRRQ